jgi:small-conductance mechanosensitive channel
MKIEEGVRHSLSGVVSFLGFSLALIIGVSAMGVDLTNLAIIASALSVGIGFGLQNIINNFVSGIIILFERPFKVGDWVIYNGEEGKIKQINIRSTEIETFKRASIIIPNATLLSSAVTNLTHENNWSRQSLTIKVAYGSDVDKVKDILLEIANSHKLVLKNPAPYIVFKDFGASSLDFDLRCYTDNLWDGWSIPSDLRFEIYKRFNEEGIEIPFQQIVVHNADK